MANGWTPDRRAREYAAIRNWRPRERSTGSRTAQGKARTSQNDFKGGHRALAGALSAHVAPPPLNYLCRGRSRTLSPDRHCSSKTVDCMR